MRLAWGIAIALISAWTAPAAIADQADDVRTAQQAVADKDWPRAIAFWQRLYLTGAPEASAALCRLYFDGRPGGFEAGRVVDQCGRAAADGDAGALYRMGLIYLVGLGVEQNADQTQALCSAALTADPPVPAGFCLAAARHEKNRQDKAVLRSPTLAASAPVGAADGDGGPRLRCDRAFAGGAGEFDPAAVRQACTLAAAAGEPAARYHLGLMELVGLGGAHDPDAASTHCAEAQRDSNSEISAAFCLAAAAQLHRNAANLALSRATGSLDADPTTGQALPKTRPDPFALERFLDIRHTTATGLAYTCREINDWGLFEAPDPIVVTARDLVFGRKLVDYRPADYQALDQAAAACETGVAAIDPSRISRAPVIEPRRVDLFIYRQFRESLPALRARQAALLAEIARSVPQPNPVQPSAATRR